MTKVALITDTHWGVRNDSPIFLEYFNKCYSDFFFPELEKRNIKHCIHLGDLVDRRKYININTAHNLRKYFLEPLSERNIETHFIVGNHDEYYKDTNKVNFHQEFFADKYKNFYVYINPKEININNTEILLIPWICKENEDVSYDIIKKSSAPICFGHLEIGGFEMDKGFICEDGADHRIYSKFALVCSGHFHHKSSNNNIRYIGAFAEYTFSDYNDPRGFSIFDTETYDIEFIQNPYKMFHTIIYDDIKYAYTYEKIDSLKLDRFNNTYVKIVCANRNDSMMFEYFIEALYKSSPADISIVESVNIINDNNEDDIIDQSENTPTIINKYIDGLTLSIDNARMKKIMKDIYSEAITLEETME